MSDVTDWPTPDMSAEHILKEAIRNARGMSRRSVPRWLAVAGIFGLDEFRAKGLCRWAGLDPGKEVRRWTKAPIN